MSRSMPREVADFLRELAFGRQPMGLSTTRAIARQMVEKYAPARYVPGQAVVIDALESHALQGTVYRVIQIPGRWLYDIAIDHTVDVAGVQWATLVERIDEDRLTPKRLPVQLASVTL